MSGTKIDRVRDLRRRQNHATPAGDRIDRMAMRTEWAGRALEHAGEDLREAGVGDGALEGLTEVVLDQAGRVSRLAKDIESRQQDVEGKGAR